MGHLQFTIDNLDGYDPSGVARTVLGKFWQMGVYAHLSAYHADVFLDNDILANLANVSGIYMVRESGTHYLPLEVFRTMTGDETLETHMEMYLRNIGTHMTRCFLLLDGLSERGWREVVVSEFNPQSEWNIAEAVKKLERVHHEKS